MKTTIYSNIILLCAVACVFLSATAAFAVPVDSACLASNKSGIGNAIEPATSIRCPNTLRGGYQIEDYLSTVAGSLDDNASIIIKVEQIGFSLRKWPISLVTISSRELPGNTKGGVLAIAAQHGDEPAGTVAAMRLIHQIAVEGNQNLHQLLRDVPFYIIPVANPDAAQAFKRRAANGKNMNRDWVSYSLPETQAIEKTIKRLQPDVLLDLHELTAGEPNRPYVEGVSLLGKSSVTQSVKTAFHRQGIRVPVRSSRPTSRGGRLLHRHFALKYGRPAFLVESKCPGDPRANLDNRTNLHRATVVAVLNALAAKKSAGADKSNASKAASTNLP